MKVNINRIKINSKKSTKLCILADIHHIKSCNDQFYELILNSIKKIKPKFILIPGDIIEHPKIINTQDIKRLINFLKKLAFIAPVLISKGNHELKSSKYNIQDFYKLINKINNIYVLDNDSIILGEYQFIGFSPSNKSYLNKYKKIWESNFISEFNNCNFKILKDKISILLCHSPQLIIDKNVQEKIINFSSLKYIICGHMHNGLAPAWLDHYLKNRGLFGPNYTLFPKYCRGIYEINKNTKIIICKSLRSLTKDNWLFKKLDYFYQKNITVIEI